MKIETYLLFNGDCREAFEFYHSVLGGTVVTMLAHRDSPAEPFVPEEWLDKILHARLEIAGYALMASDAPPGYQSPAGGYNVSLTVESEEQAERTFTSLSEGAQVITMPLQQTFWAKRFECSLTASERGGWWAAPADADAARTRPPVTHRLSRGRKRHRAKMERMSAEVSRVLLETLPLPEMPGWEMRLYLINYPPGADASGHSHPVPGMGLVLDGTMITAFDDDPEETFTAGQSFQDLASFHRVSRNGSTTEPMRFIIAYTVRQGEPNTVWPKP